MEYKNGKVIAQKIRVFYDDELYYEIFENGTKTRLEYPFLDTQGKNVEDGVFRNAKPHSGYFFDCDAPEISLVLYRDGAVVPGNKKGIGKALEATVIQD